jgi:ketosteroid isomerase-like protein
VSATSQRELIERFIAAYNAFDIEGMVAHLSPDVRFENYSGDNLTAATNGITEFRQLAEESKSLFSEREQRISSIQFDGRTAIVTIEYRGRFAVDVPNGPRAGEVIELRGTSEYSFRDGRITKIIDRG